MPMFKHELTRPVRLTNSAATESSRRWNYRVLVMIASAQ